MLTEPLKKLQMLSMFIDTSGFGYSSKSDRSCKVICQNGKNKREKNLL